MRAQGRTVLPFGQDNRAASARLPAQDGTPRAAPEEQERDVPPQAGQALRQAAETAAAAQAGAAIAVRHEPPASPAVLSAVEDLRRWSVDTACQAWPAGQAPSVEAVIDRASELERYVRLGRRRPAET